MGTDLSFTIAEPEPEQLIDAVKLVAHERAAILDGNAAKLLGIGA